jgi:hypothetical protein
MTRSRRTDRQDDPDGSAAAREDVVQIHLEEIGQHSCTDAVVGAVIGAGGGPAYRFVAAPSDSDHDASEHAAVGAKFPDLLSKQLWT